MRKFVCCILVAMTLTAVASGARAQRTDQARRRRAELVYAEYANVTSTSLPSPPQVDEVVEEQVARVAADAAVRRLLPIVLRSLGLTSEASEFEGAAPTHDEASLASLGDAALRLARRIRAAAPASLSVANARRVQRAARLAWGATYPLRRSRAAPSTAVLALYRDLFVMAHRIDPAASCRVAADVVAGADAVIRRAQ